MLQAKNGLISIVRSNYSQLHRYYHCAMPTTKSHIVRPTQFLEGTNNFDSSLCLDMKIPLLQSIRWRTPLGITRTKVPHKRRALVLELTFEKYNYPLKDLPVSETCINAVKNKYAKKTEVSPYERMLAREFLEEVEAGQMLVFVHLHPCNSYELFDQRVLLHRNNMKYMWHPSSISRLAFADAKYKSLLPMYSRYTSSIISYDKDFKKLLTVERRLPSMTVLAAVVENRVLSVEDLKRAAELPSLPLMHGTLLSTLGAQQQRLSRHLTAHQEELAGSLERYSSTAKEETTPA